MQAKVEAKTCVFQNDMKILSYFDQTLLPRSSDSMSRDKST